MKIICPNCKKEIDWSADNPYRPFCSDRCKLIDLGEWASGQRGIPGDHAPSAEEDQPEKSKKQNDEYED
jgi:uncharacterized protein